MVTKWGPEEAERFSRIKDGVVHRGKREGDAEEIAAEAVDRRLAQEGRASGPPAVPRGACKPLEHCTLEELYLLARQRQIPGRSRMNKAQLIEALQRE